MNIDILSMLLILLLSGSIATLICSLYALWSLVAAFFPRPDLQGRPRMSKGPVRIFDCGVVQVDVLEN